MFYIPVGGRGGAFYLVVEDESSSRESLVFTSEQQRETRAELLKDLAPDTK